MKTYKVIGSRPFRGHNPGETFEADLSADQEARFIRRGSIKVAGETEVRETTETEAPSSTEETSSQGGGHLPGQRPGLR